MGNLKAGETRKILKIVGPQAWVERLRELGFLEDSHVTFIGKSPLGNPYIFRNSETSVCLREEEVSCLMFE